MEQRLHETAEGWNPALAGTPASLLKTHFCESGSVINGFLFFELYPRPFPIQTLAGSQRNVYYKSGDT